MRGQRKSLYQAGTQGSKRCSGTQDGDQIKAGFEWQAKGEEEEEAAQGCLVYWLIS